jgi:SHS2 domain-containing protein
MWTGGGEPVEEEGFRYEEHTADAGFRAWAPTLSGAFEQAALALSALVCDTATVQHAVVQPLEVTAENEEELLFAFLAELLFIHDSQGILLGKIEVTSLDKEDDIFRLKGTVNGEPYDRKRHVLLGGIKAPTYHNLAIHRKNDGVEVSVFVDV